MFRKMKESDFDKVYELMEESFPLNERKSYEKQKEALLNIKFNIYTIGDKENDEIKAFISLWEICDFIFIDHFAVSNNYRNEGLGAKILEETKDFFKKRIFLETEPEDDDIASRRINFYKRNGFTLNKYEYNLPALGEGRTSIPMMIMSTEGELGEEEFKQIKDELYKVVYNI